MNRLMLYFRLFVGRERRRPSHEISSALSARLLVTPVVDPVHKHIERLHPMLQTLGLLCRVKLGENIRRRFISYCETAIWSVFLSNWSVYHTWVQYPILEIIWGHWKTNRRINISTECGGETYRNFFCKHFPTTENKTKKALKVNQTCISVRWAWRRGIFQKKSKWLQNPLPVHLTSLVHITHVSKWLSRELSLCTQRSKNHSILLWCLRMAEGGRTTNL